MIAMRDCGESPAAQFVQRELTRHNSFLHKSAALGIEQVLREELAEVWEECSQPDWDAYDAFPVSWDSLVNAKRLLLALRLGTELPSIGAIPSGHVTLEWHHSRRRTLTVSVTPEGDLQYAALLGPGRVCGTEPFFGEAPQVILDLIGRVYQC